MQKSPEEEKLEEACTFFWEECSFYESSPGMMRPMLVFLLKSHLGGT